MKKLTLLAVIVLTAAIVNAQNSPEFGDRVDLGLIEHTELVEASGLVESRKNAHVLWSHNDRNHQNRLFAFNSSGEHLGIYWLDGVNNRDWEDIAVGPGPQPGVDYLYIGDIGDNASVYDFKYIYRVPEPVVYFNQNPVEITIFNVDTIIFQYPDGKRDAETLMLDPLTKDIFIVSKREFEDIRVYRAPYPQPTNQVITLEHVATLNLWSIVGGDISPSGLEILLKTYTTMYYWNRTQNQNLWEAFNNAPVVLPYIEEVQGEAVCWASDSMGYYTLSEEGFNIPAHLYFYPRINSAPVIINEIMQNPLAVNDDVGEWFEIYNNSTNSIDLNGWTIRDTDLDFHMISQSLVLSPGEYIVLGNNSDSTINGGVQVAYQYDNFELDNLDDEIMIISSSGEVVDSVAYDNGTTFPNPEGASMALLDPNMDNNFGLNWRESNWIFGDGDRGTPGSSNSGTIPYMAIREIQYTTDPTGESPLLGQRVTISGVLSIEPFGFFKDNFFIQDSVGMWSGIRVKHTAGVQKGDSVRLTGTVAEANNGLTIMIDVSNFKILQIGVFGIDPIPLTTGEIRTGGTNAEAYESVLITVTGVCDNENIGWKEWSIDDSTGSTRVYHALLGDFTPVLGNQYEVTGIQYYSRDNNFKIFPRDSSDIIGPLSLLDDMIGIPRIFKLHQNFPNPFNASTSIDYQIPTTSKVTLSIYNILGQKIITLVDFKQSAGVYKFRWDGTNEKGVYMSSGVYLYRLNAGSYNQTRKLLLLR